MKPMFDVIFNKVTKFVCKHSVEIAMGAAAVGVGLTVYTTSKATLKVDKIVRNNTLTKEEKIKKSAKHCIAPAASVILAYAGIFAMYHFGKKKQAALLGLLVSTQQLFQNYRIETKKKVGDKEESEIFAKAIEKTNKIDEIKLEKKPKEDECIFVEPITGQVFTMKTSELIEYEKELNKLYILTGSVTFDEWLSMLEVDSDELFSHYGWGYYGYYQYGYQFIDIRHLKRTDKNGQEFYILMYDFMPHADYEDEVDYELFEADPHYHVELEPEFDTNYWSTRDIIRDLCE